MAREFFVCTSVLIFRGCKLQADAEDFHGFFKFIYRRERRGDPYDAVLRIGTVRGGVTATPASLQRPTVLLARPGFVLTQTK